MSVSNTPAHSILSMDKEARKVALLKYLWQMMPGLSNKIVQPDETTKLQLCDKFIQDAGGLRYPDHFAAFVKKYGYPWVAHNTLSSGGGVAWNTAFSMAFTLSLTGEDAAKKSKDTQIQDMKDFLVPLFT
jgi:hypothetical protein